MTATATAPETIWRKFSDAAARMVEIIQESSRDPELRAKAIEIIQPAATGMYGNELRLLFEFVRDQMKYIGDTNGEDIFQWPALTLENLAADCNNRVLLLGALARSVGFPVRLIFLWEDFNADIMNEYPVHVWMDADLTKGEQDRPIWIPLETTPTRDPVAMATNLKMEFGQEFPTSGQRVYYPVD